MATVSAVTANLLFDLSMPHVAEPEGLVGRAKAGDSSACRALFEAHGPSVYSLILRLANGTLDAEILTRDIFLAAFANLNSIPDDDAFAVELRRQAAKTALAKRFRRGVNNFGGAASQPEPASQ